LTSPECPGAYRCPSACGEACYIVTLYEIRGWVLASVVFAASSIGSDSWGPDEHLSLIIDLR
jgi:hypothetical protein